MEPITEYVYEASLDGCSEELGDVQDFGWYGRIEFSPEDRKQLHKLGATGRLFGAILHEDNYGFKDAELYASKKALKEAWAELEAQEAKFYAEGDAD